MAIGEFQPIDLLGMQGGLGNIPTAANVQALGMQQQKEAEAVDAFRANAMANQAQAMQAAQEQQRAQQFQQALATHLGDGSAQSTARLMTQFPEFAKQLGDAHALEKADIQEADTLQLNGIYSRASNGDWAGAAANAKRRLDAEMAAGNDTTDEQDLYDALTSNDPVLQKRALGIVGMDLAARVGIDKFASVYGGVTTTDGNVVNRGTGAVTYQGQEKPEKPQRMVVDGTVLEFGGNAGGGGSPASVVDAIIGVEGTAKNPNSSAVGVGQFVDGTWIEQFKARYPNTTLSVPEILKLKTNPKLARDLTAQYVEANTAKLGAAGVATDAPSVYLAHFLGPQDAIDVLRANPSTPVADIVAPESIAANKSVLAGKTAGEVRQWAAGKMGGASGGPRVVYQGPSSGEKSVKKDVIAMRKEFDALSEVKAYKEIAPVLMSARRAPDTPAGDIQLAYTVGKILDPNSVVREGELALAIKAGSPLERLLGQGTYVAGQGARMTPEIRRQLLEMVNERALAVRQQYDAARANYEGYARDMGVAPASIIGQHVANAYAPKGGGKPASSGPVPVNSPVEAAALPAGTLYRAPDGVVRRR